MSNLPDVIPRVSVSISAAMRSDFGHDHYAYLTGNRMLVGTTRTFRPVVGESGEDFRLRINGLVGVLETYPTTGIEVDEEIRAGVIVQAVIRVRYTPEPCVIQPDRRAAGGRPSGARGVRGK